MPQTSTHTFTGDYQNGSVFGLMSFTYDVYVLHAQSVTDIIDYDVFPYSLSINGTIIILNDINSFSQVGTTQTSVTTNFAQISSTFPSEIIQSQASNSGCFGLGSTTMTKITKTYQFNAPQYFYENNNIQTTTYLTIDSTDVNVGTCPQYAKVVVTSWINEIEAITQVGTCVELGAPTYSGGRLIGQSEYVVSKTGFSLTASNLSSSPQC
jgi:hypothetical protein